MSRSPGLSNLCKSRRLAPGAGVGGGPPPASPPPSQPPGSCLNTLKQSKSNYHAQAAREHLLHPPLGIANAPAQSADRRRAPRVSRVARCSCAMAPRHHPAAWHGEAAEPTFPALPAQLSLRAISRRIITPRSHTYGTSYLQNIYFNTCQGPPRVVGRASASRTGSWRGAFFLEERGVGRELGREHTGGGAGLGWGPHPRAQGSHQPSPRPWLLPWCCHSCRTAACSVISVGGQPGKRNHRRYFGREDLIQGLGETGAGGLKGQKGTHRTQRDRPRSPGRGWGCWKVEAWQSRGPWSWEPDLGEGGEAGLVPGCGERESLVQSESHGAEGWGVFLWRQCRDKGQ